MSVPELGYIIPAMAASAPFTLGGFLARFAFALLVAGATYNPTRYSYYAWAKRTGFEWSPPTVFVGVVLLIGWFVENPKDLKSALEQATAFKGPALVNVMISQESARKPQQFRWHS